MNFQEDVVLSFFLPQIQHQQFFQILKMIRAFIAFSFLYALRRSPNESCRKGPKDVEEFMINVLYFDWSPKVPDKLQIDHAT